MKVINEEPITLLAEENCIIIPKGKPIEPSFISNTFITLAKDDKLENYEEVNLDNIQFLTEELQNIENDLQKEE